MSESSSTPMTSKSDADKEELLDRLLTRLAFCEDSNLQSLLSKLLPLTLSSLASPSTSVRNKVLEILSHVNKRVKHRPDVGLPLHELWSVYLDANSNSMVKNFCIVYIEMAFERVTPKEKENMTTVLVSNISKLPSQHQDIILRIVTKAIGECHAKQIDEEAAEKYRSLNDLRDRDLFVEFCLHLMLYQRPAQGGGCPPGLSLSQANRVAGKNPLTNEELLMRKLGVLNVIDAMELSPELVYPVYLAASADSREAIIKRGEDLLKKKASTADLDDVILMNRLFLLFNGTTGTENIPLESRVSPGNVTLRTKLMSIFCRSITAANSFPATLQCIFGCMYGSATTSRLQQLGMEFTVWVFKHAKTEQLKLMGPVILNGILKLLDAYPPSESDTVARATKSFSFQAIGLLAQRLPYLFRDKIDMVIRLFNALKVESQSLRLAIQEATSSLATAYKEAPANVLMELEEILLKNSQAEENEVRFCAVRWATSLFGSQHCPSRFICMLATADSRLDTREMALEGLFPHTNTSQNIDPRYPRLEDMLNYILNQQPKLADSSETREQPLIFPAKMYMTMIKFLLKCLETELEQDFSARSSEYVLLVERMCLLLEHAMAYDGSFELHATASKAIITIGSYFPELVASRYAPRISWLKQFLGHVDLDTRESAARLLGIACSAVPTDASSDLLHDLLSISRTNNLRFEAHCGALCAMGYVTGEFVSRTPPIPDALFQDVLKCFMDVVTSESATLASVAMQALGHIGLRVPLPPLVKNSISVDVLVHLQENLKKFLASDDGKAIQKIVISLGHVCVKETSPSLLNIALDLIFSLCRSKVEDVLFAAGEALSFLWGGVPVTADVILKTNYSSLSLTSNFLLGDMSVSLSKYCFADKPEEANEDYHVTVREAITKKLFEVLLYSSRKEERCAGAVWLLSLTMYCGRHPTIQHMLPEIQEAFSHLLGEQNELTQELASQGMGIVYELGDASTKKQLIDALVTTLTGSGKRKRAIKLVGDSEVFQEGAIGESLSGGKLSTYKELCNLATEMGQPDLIYKFMDLANHQALLNSKRGAAVGFSKIAKQAGDALKPHLRLLVPRLVRYQHDPDKNVQDAMVHIWRSLIADPKKTIDDHFDLIVEDLVTQCGSRVWRSREASSLALSDIIQGQTFNKVGKHLRIIWAATFRVMDDIKETVRIAGDRLCRSVTSLTIRLCDASLTNTSDAGKTMEIALPFLLEEGILSKVKSIQKASIDVVMKLAKGAGTALRPHLPDLVCCMLESLSSLEDQGLNYIELHAANVGIQMEKLDNLRISIAKGSPMWETLDLCINVTDTKTLDLLIPRLANSVRSGVGLNTRVGVANFISLLVEKVGTDIKPFTSMLLRLMFPVVKEEKSAVVKRAFSNACATILKHSGSSQAQNLIQDTVALIMGEKNEQLSCALLLKSYSFIASDVLSRHQAMIIPVVFISRFDDDKNISTMFEELWDDSTSGERVATQLYLGEIVSLVCEGLKKSSWTSKRKSALAICKLCGVLNESLSSHYNVLLECLTKELQGRLWEGKEALLDAIGALCVSCHKAIVSENASAPSEILSLVSSACTKKVKKYREAAFSSLDQVLKAFGSPEFFNVVFPSLYEMFNLAAERKAGVAPISRNAPQAEPEAADDSSVPVEKLLQCMTSCVNVAHLNDIVEQKKLMHTLTISLSPGFQWTVRLSALPLIKGLCSRLQNVLDECGGTFGDARINSLVEELFQSISPKIMECINTIKIAQFHIAASESLLEITNLYKNINLAKTTDLAFKEELIHICEVEKNEEAKTHLKRCLDIIVSLQQ